MLNFDLILVFFLSPFPSGSWNETDSTKSNNKPCTGWGSVTQGNVYRVFLVSVLIQQAPKKISLCVSMRDSVRDRMCDGMCDSMRDTLRDSMRYNFFGPRSHQLPRTEIESSSCNR